MFNYDVVSFYYQMREQYTSLNIRVTKSELKKIKASAKNNKYPMYSTWCRELILDACNSKPISSKVQDLETRLKTVEILLETAD